MNDALSMTAAKEPATVSSVTDVPAPGLPASSVGQVPRTEGPRTPVRGASNRNAGEELLYAARRSLFEAAVCDHADDRYVTAHLAALRAGAAVLAVRGRPATRRIHSVWTLLPRIAPELGEWAEYFEITARRRAAVESGVRTIGGRDADDLLRDAQAFVAAVCELLEIPQQLGVDSVADRLRRAG